MKRFLIVAACVAIVWGVVLPRLAKTNTVRERNAWLKEKQIDPAAMFYTELPLMDRVLAGR
ncbi:hypothetical protein [Rhodopirellula sp. MGV]|uniref:hypothetical protein n=1 Tax=Rhodopirellula sp. MGV TaxID=2023130 RepID=UPI000B970CE2|nr:hypothetical protein [Rhodopirellula sp. MGV]OYP35499.1 hypothetical protein CGZ80_11700 [Rhodopirellula sp. MGV]PNY33940.1 hypothetical protein C2E31_26340 [Rhodopirellula baltica]